MEKLGVVIDDEKTKEASENGNSPLCCPKCNKRIHSTDGGLPNCLNCGTEPFEKRQGKE
jgi:ribosomal protein L37AE/L43A